VVENRVEKEEIEVEWESWRNRGGRNRDRDRKIMYRSLFMFLLLDSLVCYMLV